MSVILMSMPPGVTSGNVLMFTTNYYCQPATLFSQTVVVIEVMTG